MERKRYRQVLMVLIIALIIGLNFITVPLFLYGSFGSDATLDFSRVEWVLNILLLAWVFLILPNLPLAGMLVSVRQFNQRYLYMHTAAFLSIAAAAVFFYMGESRLFWGSALVLTHIGGLVSLALLWMQLKGKKNTPKNNRLPHSRAH